jgi:hypothetical protein
VRTKRLEWHRWQRTIGANTIDSAGEIDGGIGERAIKIEQHGLDVEPERRRGAIRHDGST